MSDLVNLISSIPEKFQCEIEKEELKYFTLEQLHTFFSVIERPNHHLICKMLYELAPRITEARMIQFKDVDHYTGKIKVPTLKQGRPIPIRLLTGSDSLIKTILGYQKDRKLSDQDFLFATAPGKKPLTGQHVGAIMKQHIKKSIGPEYIEDLGHAHTFRHTRAIQLLDTGEMNISQLQQFLGHKTILSTVIYLKYTSNHIGKNVRLANKQLGVEYL